MSFTLDDVLASSSKSLLDSAAARRIRCSGRGVLPRVRSILDDAAWLSSAIASSHSTARLPLFANLRAGAWHAPLGSRTCYFKSTEGHHNEWAFSLTRLNLELAVTAASCGGAIVVDVTAAGKRFPDSFVTLAIWAAVVNAVVLRTSPLALLRSSFPPWLPPSFLAPIERVVVETCATLASPIREAMCGALAGRLQHPLVPVYACQPSSLPEGKGEGEAASWESVWPSLDAAADDAEEGYPPHTTPLLCVSASRFVDARYGDAKSAHGGWIYVQGAGDDAEGWAGPLGLNPALMWAHAEALAMCESNTACEALIRELAAAAAETAAPPSSLAMPSMLADGTADAADAASLRRLIRAAFFASAPVLGCPLVHVATSSSAWAMGIDAPPDNASILDDGVLSRTTMILVEAASEDVTPAQAAACVSLHSGGFVRLLLPTSKRAQCRYKEVWVDSILPAVAAAARAAQGAGEGARLLVGFHEPLASAPAAMIAAAAHLAVSSGVLDKATLKAAVACAAISCHTPSVDRMLLQQLSRFFLTP